MACTVELLCIGNELLIGKIPNSNAQWLAEQITRLGGRVDRITVVRDELSPIIGSLRSALDRKPDFILTTGGLGPTFDDMTLEGVTRALDRPLELNDVALRMIKRRLERAVAEGRLKDLRLTESRKKMATLPEGSIPLENPEGSAPGVLVETANSRVISLPGVPPEMKAIFTGSVKPLILEMSSNLNYFEKSLIVRGIGESSLSPLIDQVMGEFPDIYVKSHPRKTELYGRFIELHLSALCENPKEAKPIIEKACFRASGLIVERGADVHDAREEEIQREIDHDRI